MQLTPNSVIQTFVSYFMFIYIGAKQGYCTKFQHCPHGDPTKDIINSLYLYIMADSYVSFIAPTESGILFSFSFSFFFFYFFYDLAIGL